MSERDDLFDGGYSPRRIRFYLAHFAALVGIAEHPSAGRGENHWTAQHPEKRVRGESHHNAKLTAEQAAEIRRRYAAGGISQKALAAEYGMSQSSIWKIINGVAWQE